MANKEILRRENDFVLQKLTIGAFNGAEYDITKMMTTLTFEESIFQGSIHGSITMIDTIDYPTLLPIIGEETIKASFTRAESGLEPGLLPSLEFSARVYKMSAREIQGTSDKVQNYTLYFASEELFKSAQSKVNQGFKSALFSDIVKEIFETKMKVSKDLEVEETKHDQDYVITNKSPQFAIREICKRSISTDTGSSFYLFYEDRDSFHFKTIDYLMKQAPSKEIKYRVQNVLEGSGSGHKDRSIEEDIDTVQHYHHNSTFDVFEDLLAGKASSRILTVDPIRQKFEIQDFDLNTEFDSFTHLENSKPFTDASPILNSPEASFSMCFTNKDHDTVEHLVSRDSTVRPKQIEMYELRRQSQVKQITRHLTSTSMSGDPRMKAGQVISFVLPELMGKVSKEFPQELDKYLQGKFLIASIAHIVKQNAYYVNLELMKDSFFSDIRHRDPLKEVNPEEIY